MSDAPCIQPLLSESWRIPYPYRGRRVVPFESRGLTSSERNGQMLETPPTMWHGSLIGHLIQERKDVAVSRGRRGPRDRHATFWAARDWALRVGFTEPDIYRAARGALDLRKQHGGGNVTKAMVLDLMTASPEDDPHSDEDLLAGWEQVDRRLQEVVDESTYRIWLEDLSARHFVADTWMLECHPEYVAWVRVRFGGLIERAAGASVVLAPRGAMNAKE